MLLIPNRATFAVGEAGYQKRENVILLAELTTEYAEVHLKPHANLGFLIFFFFFLTGG